MSLRTATAADAVALRDLERAANVIALAHVFPPDRFPYPDEEVLVRWRRTVADPAVHTLVLDGDVGLDCLVAHDRTCVRHLAVRPERWGSGLARAALDLAVEAIRAGGCDTPALWCLTDNHRARGLYEHLGWRRSGRTQPAEWPPFPVEAHYVLPPAVDP